MAGLNSYGVKGARKNIFYMEFIYLTIPSNGDSSRRSEPKVVKTVAAVVHILYNMYRKINSKTFVWLWGLNIALKC